MEIGINMSFCEYAELRDNKWYCLGTKEIDPCPCNGNLFSKNCYYPKERKETMRKHPVNSINLELIDFAPFENEWGSGVLLSWTSDIGFGQYTLYRDKNGKFAADSEHMDSNEDKDFIKELMRLFIEKLRIDY